SARSTTWLVRPFRAAASASVMPTRPPPRIRSSRLSLIGMVPRTPPPMRASTIPFLKALLTLLMLALALPAGAQAPVPARDNHIAAELIASGPVVPGEPLELALLFRAEEGWHGYWK